MKHPHFAFFGTPHFAVTILDELKNKGFLPALVITAPDKPQGRGLILTAPPVKIWAQENNVPYLQPEKLSDIFDELSAKSWDLFIVAAYGKILPEKILEIPKHKTLNVHPSLLPSLRGPSPIEAAILRDMHKTGVSIMRLDKEMDHGPIVAQQIISNANWPVTAPILENVLAHAGGALLAKVLPDWLSGKIKEKEQNHATATYCKMISKADGLVDLADDPYKNYLKICAYTGWPGTYFFMESQGKKIRVNIKEAAFKDGELSIIRVIPEGKKEMLYSDFLRGHTNPTIS